MKCGKLKYHGKLCRYIDELFVPYKSSTTVSILTAICSRFDIGTINRITHFFDFMNHDIQY